MQGALDANIGDRAAFSLAGSYGTYAFNEALQEPPAANAPADVDWSQFGSYTPAALAAWFAARPGWRSFDGGFLRMWGGRWLPHVAAEGRWWLWFTPGEHSARIPPLQCHRESCCQSAGMWRSWAAPCQSKLLWGFCKEHSKPLSAGVRAAGSRSSCMWPAKRGDA